jgi:TRAP-type C4-dicarboxylate transport system substrate-binding protein
MTPRLIAVNEKTWATIAPKDQQAIKAALDTNSQWQDNEILSQESGLADTFKKSGMEVIQPDVESFRKPVLDTLPKKFESKWGAGLWERIASL